MSKNVYKRRIDERPTLDIGGTPATATASPAPPAPPALPAPVITSITTAIYQSAQTPAAKVDLTWTYETTVPVQSYLVQWSTDSTFATNVNGAPANGVDKSASIFPLPAATLYYFRVAALVGTQNTQSPWSASASITTASDTTVPAAPSSPAGSFIGSGDFLVTFTPSTSANVKWHEVRIWESASKATLYTTIYTTTNSAIWTAAQNVASVAAGDPSLYAEVRAQSWGGFFSTAVNTGLVTKAAPSAPTVTHNWTGDTGTAGPDLVLSWAAIADAAKYRVSLNGGTARDWAATTYTYTLEANRAQNTTPDPTITYSITAVDGLGQSSSAASGTATNAAPTAPTVAIKDGVSMIIGQVTSAAVADFLAYEYVWKRDGATQRTLESRASEDIYETTNAGDEGSHSWTVTVRQKDVFGQFSSATASSAVVHEGFTTAQLRAGALYSDSAANTFIPPASGTLAALKDTDTTAGGVSYAA